MLRNPLSKIYSPTRTLKTFSLCHSTSCPIQDNDPPPRGTTVGNTAAPSNRTTHFYYPLVIQRGCPSPRIFAERGRAPALICIPPRPVLATYGVIPASNGRDYVPKGYDGSHRRESTTRFQRHPLKLRFPQCSFICWWYIYAHFPYVITSSYSALGNEACFRARRQGYP